MRIWYFSSSKICSREANSIQVMQMCAALAAAGHQVTLFARRGSEAELDSFAHYGVTPNFEVLRLEACTVPVLSKTLHARAVQRVTRGMPRPDLIYGRHLLSLLLAAPRGVRMMYEAHAVPGRLNRWLQRRLFARPEFARLVAISSALRDDLHQLHPGLPPEKILLAPDGAPEVSTTMPVPRSHLGGRNDSLQVGYFGHLYPGKGGELIVELAHLRPDVDFHLFGGMERDIAQLRELAGNLPNLRLHGFYPPGSLCGWQAACDVLIAPYQRRVETAGRLSVASWMSPLKIFEYMAAGRALLCSDLPVLREILEHDVNAWLADPDDLTSWCRALDLLADPERRARLGETARQDFLNHYTWQRRAERILEGAAPATTRQPASERLLR